MDWKVMKIGRYQILFWWSRHNWCLRFGVVWPSGDSDPKKICTYRAWQIGPLEIRHWFLTDAEAYDIAEEESTL